MMEWQPLETLPESGWVLGKLEVDGKPPAFVGEPYRNPWQPKDEPCRWLINRWNGRWITISAWAPLPTASEASVPPVGKAA